MSEPRRFSDSFGFHWQVCEVLPRPSEVGREVRPAAVAADGGWLYFFSRETTRVLHDYPTEWELLSWPELEDLCARARLMGNDRLERPALRRRAPAAELRV